MDAFVFPAARGATQSSDVTDLRSTTKHSSEERVDQALPPIPLPSGPQKEKGSYKQLANEKEKLRTITELEDTQLSDIDESL